jgi:hypothetical protein
MKGPSLTPCHTLPQSTSKLDATLLLYAGQCNLVKSTTHSSRLPKSLDAAQKRPVGLSGRAPLWCVEAFWCLFCTRFAAQDRSEILTMEKPSRHRAQSLRRDLTPMRPDTTAHTRDVPQDRFVAVRTDVTCPPPRLARCVALCVPGKPSHASALRTDCSWRIKLRIFPRACLRCRQGAPVSPSFPTATRLVPHVSARFRVN